MNLDHITIIYNSVILVLLVTLFPYKIKSKRLDLIADIAKILLYLVLFYFHYYLNYEQGVERVKITYECTKNSLPSECTTYGIITYRPYMDEIELLTTPKYPVLNCPNGDCIQEHLYINKTKVKKLIRLDNY